MNILKLHDQHKNSFSKPGKTGRVINLCIVAVLALSAFLSGSTTATAQSPSDSWTPPVNLSHSGTASNPIQVVDPEGMFHIIWMDTFAEYVYITGDGSQWTSPVPVSLPFETYTPALLAGPDGKIFAFWIDVESELYTSWVLTAKFADSRAWSRPQMLVESAIDFDVSLDSAGVIHLAYLQPLETIGFLPGVYYMQLARLTWSKPQLLYQSPYFRSLTPDTSNIRISTTGTPEANRIFVAFDNPARERVYVTRSDDNGVTWIEPLEVDAPVDGSITGGPSNITVDANGQNALLVWQTNQSGLNCVQFFQWSTDNGNTWQPRQRMLADLPGCPRGNSIFTTEDGTTFLMTTIYKQSYLLAWNGTRWSAPQPQIILSGFVDSDTFKPVDFGCRQAVLVRGSLYVIGCDEGSGKDIWITSRSLGNAADWFNQSAVWNPLSTIATSDARVVSPVMLSDSGNRVHALWSQESAGSFINPGNLIYYAKFEGGQWSKPLAVLASPVGKAEQPAAAIDQNGNMYVVWSGGLSGETYFSHVVVARAVIASAWSEPILLPALEQAGSSPDILLDHQGRIYVANSIPLNEKRGIYLTWSDDGGQTWAQPVTLFDAAAAGWAMVDHPKLSLTGNGYLHVVWERFSLPSGTGSMGIYYARSENRGASWSSADMVTDKPVSWSRIVGIGDQTIHRVWQEMSNGRSTLWHEISLDGGVTWSRISPVSIFGEAVGEPALAQDQSGRLHLLQIINRGVNSYALQHWVWDGSTWQGDQGMDLSSSASARLNNLVASVSADHDLSVAFSGDTVSPLTGLTENQLFFASRALDLPQAAAALNEPVTTPLPPATPTGAPKPTVTPTAGLPLSEIQGGGPLVDPGQPGNAWLGSIIGPMAAGLIVLVVFVISVRGMGWGRRKSL